MMKKYLTIKEVSQITGISVSYLHKLTANRIIEFYRPFGKRIYFTQEQIDQIFVSARVKRKKDLLIEGKLKNTI